MIPEVKQWTKTGEFICPGEFRLEENDFGQKILPCLERLQKFCTGQGPLPLKLREVPGKEGAYSLSIQPGGICVEADESGIFPALSTLQNLLVQGAIPAGEILDYARFSHRGYMQDDARHFQGADAACEALEILFRFKMNVFHWHISDDQGFRLDLPGYERLSRHASRRNSSNKGGYTRNQPDNVPYSALYTREEVEKVLRCARERGIRVIPEMDMPGHFSAILSACPEFSCTGEAIEVPGRYGVLPNVLCLGKPEARHFARQLALDVANYLGSDIIHIGFDEIKPEQLCRCPKCKAEAKRQGLSGPEQLIPLFRREVIDFLAEHGIRAIAWDDENSVPGPENDIILYHWRPESNRKAVSRANCGQRTVMCDFYHHYADYPYCMTPLKKTYRYNPVLRGIQKTENVIGLETPLWAEFLSDPRKREMNGFYRIAAVAENAWNDETCKQKYDDFFRELRSREEYYFGKVLDVPESILNPSFPVRLARLIRCLKKDSDWEVKLWLKEKANREEEK